jgi:hypothetical protein
MSTPSTQLLSIAQIGTMMKAAARRRWRPA